MAYEVFCKEAPEFEHWLDEHPDGYVLNCYKTGKLHTAFCTSYRVHGQMTSKRAKACSTSKRQLYTYAAQKGYDVPEHCQQCFG